MKDLSKLTPVKPDQGKAQWVEGQVTGIAKDEPKRTHLIGIPPLMPCTTIFVHGVNSDGEWYDDAAGQFVEGLNRRLGRIDLERSEYDKNTKRFTSKNTRGQRARVPILPFYWGYKVPPKLRIKLVDHERTADRPDAWADRHGNPLRSDGSWGGGPFQNGTHNLQQFWQGGFDKGLCQHLWTWVAKSLLPASAVLLTACGLGGPYPGVPDLHDPRSIRPSIVEVAAPQVAYRIDENRYFEIVPYGPGACTNAMVHFVDKAKGIRSEAVKFDRGSMLRATLVIDASNDQYLVAPVTRGNTDCSSGGGLCGGSKLPYSTDGGRTWKRVEVPFAYGPVDSRGMHVYVSTANARIERRETEVLALSIANPSMKDWRTSDPLDIPTAKSTPIDTKLHCTANGKE